MLEIILLITFTRRIAAIAAQKGLKEGRWKLYVVLAWFGGEILGAFVGVMLLGNANYVYLLPAYALAIGSYFLIRYKLMQLPDKDDWISQIGQPEQTDLPA